MRVVFKKLLTINMTLAGFVVFLSLAQPVQAQSMPIRTVNLSASDFCQQINTVGDRMRSRLDNFNNEINQHSPAKNLSQAEANAVVDLQQKRKQWDELREQHYKMLKLRAKDENQKQAVETYKKAVESAVTERRSKVDMAVNDFDRGLNGLVDGDHSAMTGVITTYRESVSAAIIGAQNDCGAGVDPATTLATFQTKLKSALDDLRSSSTGLDKIHQDIENLQKIRRAAIQSAVDSFTQAAHTAQQALAQILGQ